MTVVFDLKKESKHKMTFSKLQEVPGIERMKNSLHFVEINSFPVAERTCLTLVFFLNRKFPDPKEC